MKTLALAAAFAAAFLASTASAEARIAWSDLDLASPAGAAAFDARIAAASERMCRFSRRPASHISDRAWCEAAVRSEAMRQLPRAAQVDYAQARASVSA